MAAIQYISPGAHTGSPSPHSQQQQPEFTVKEIFLLVAAANIDGRGTNRGTTLRRVKPSRIGHVLPTIRKFDLMEARPDRTSALDVIKQHLEQGADKPVAGTASIGTVTLTPQNKGQISKNPNSLLNVNRSGGSSTISHQPKKFVGSPPSSINHQEPALRSYDLEDTEESCSTRRIYEDPQVNSIAWANNMVEAMMSDSDDEEANRSQERENKRHKGDDDENEHRGSPSKKLKRHSTEESSNDETGEASPSNTRKKFMPKIALDLPKNFSPDLNGSNTGGSSKSNIDHSIQKPSPKQQIVVHLPSKPSLKGRQHISNNEESDDADDGAAPDNSNECTQCGKVFSKARSLQIHMEAIHLRTNFQKCPYCSKECSQVVHMVRHIKCVHYKVRHFQCLHCDSASYQKNDVVRHLQSKHKYTGYDVDSQYSEIPQKVILYDCPDCNFQSVDCETLLSHAMNEHFDAEQYEAALANTSSITRTKPAEVSPFGRGSPRHIKNPHLPNVEITPITNKSHIERSDRSEIKQNIAGPRIISPQAVPITNNKDDPSDKNEGDKYFCNTCGKGFAKVRSLQIHVEAVHLRTNFQRCPYCSKECSQAGHMVRHIKCVHYKIRHFQCNLCEVASYQKNDAVRHVQSKHKYTGADVESQFHDIPQQVILYDCPKCKFQTTECESLLDHSNKSHLDMEYINSSSQQHPRPAKTIVQGFDEDDDDDDDGQYEQQVVNIGEPEVNIVEGEEEEEEEEGVMEVEELSEDESLSEIEEEVDDDEENYDNPENTSNGIKEIANVLEDDEDEDEVEEEVEEVSE